MSADTMPIIKLGVPKGSLEEATINLFERAGWKIRKHTRNYFPDINDPQITASLCRVQEIGEYIEAGVLDVGITGLDWLTERNHEDKVVRVSDLVYSKTSNRPCRWVLAVAGDSPYQTAADLAGKRIATELQGLTQRYFDKKLYLCGRITTTSLNGGIGRHEGLKIPWPLRPCGFKSHFRYQKRLIIA